MSSMLQDLPSAQRAIERRFYPRIVPQKPFHISLTGDSELLVLNLSENGLLVSTLLGLPCNFVGRIAISLDGFSKPVQVTARVVWSNKARKLAGIQLLDLTEPDRQKIRNWGARICATPFPKERQVRAVTTPFTDKREEQAAVLAVADSTNPDNSLASPAAQAPRPTAPAQTTTSAAGKMKWPLFVGALCLAGVLLLRSGAIENPFGLSRKSRDENKPATAPPVSATTFPNPAAPASGTPIIATTATDAALTHEPVPKPVYAPASPSGEHKSGASPPVVRQSRRMDLRATFVPAQSAPSPSSLVPASTQDDEKTDLSDTSIEDAGPGSSTDGSIASDLAPETIPPPRPAEPVAPPSAAPPHNDAGVSIRPANPAPVPPLKPLPYVIQMDVPNRQVIEVHLPKGNRNSILNVRGERILETTSATVHLQRSVRLPVNRSGVPIHGDKTIAVGALLSRVDPQVAATRLAPGDYLRVHATVTEDGHVENVRFAGGQRSFLPSVTSALREWQYQPTFVDGKAVETECDVWFQFHTPPRQSARAPTSTTW